MYFLILHNNSQDADKTMNTIKLLLSKLPDALYNKYGIFLNLDSTHAICVFHIRRLSINKTNNNDRGIYRY